MGIRILLIATSVVVFAAGAAIAARRPNVTLGVAE